jgi:aspartyl-tRNA(Asn)/glutamyl-tRNA(Gln) amidotransferase subunit B
VLFGKLNESSKDIKDSPVKSNQMGEIVSLIVNGTTSSQVAKDVVAIVWNEGGSPLEIVEARDLKQVTDLSALEKLVDEIIAKNPDKVGDAKTNPKAIGWFVGQVMKASGGKANPQAVNDLLKKRLGI